MQFYTAMILSLCAGSAVAQNFPVKLVQGISRPLNTTPAEIFHLKENDESSSAIKAALISDGIGLLPLSYLGRVASELFLGASIAKTNFKYKPQDVRALHALLNSEWQLPANRSLAASLSYNMEENRKANSRGYMARADFFLTGLCQGNALDIGRSGASLKCYPYGGYYHRKILETDNAMLLPRGSHGGGYGGLLIRLSLGTVGDQGNFWAPVRFEANAYKLRDSRTSGGYEKMSFDFASLTLRYALYQNETSRWKPSISLSRAIGTDRLNNLDYVSATRLGFQISYGL